MLIDAAGLYFRAFYGVPDTVRSPEGMPVNAIRGYLDMTATLMTKRRPRRLVSCLDVAWRPAFRVELVPTYKTHRAHPDGSEQIPDTLAPQIPVLLEVLEALGLATAGAAGFEADDVIATLAASASVPTEVVTGDRDLLALATDNVRILYTGRGIAKLEDLGPAEIEGKYGIPAAHYADFAALRGDPSDGLPGVAGVGEKTAAALVRTFGTVEQILAAAHDGVSTFPAGARTKILAASDYLAVAPLVVRGRTDLKIAPTEDAVPPEPADAQRLLALADTYGLESPINRLLNAMRVTNG